MFGNVWPTATSKSNPLSKKDGITTSLCTGSAEAVVFVTYNDKEQEPNKSSRRLGRWRSQQREGNRRFVVKKLDSEVEWGEEGKEVEPEEEESREPLSSQTDNDEVHVSNERNCQVVTKSIVLGKGVTLTLTLTVSNEDEDEPVDVIGATADADAATKENNPPEASAPAFYEWPEPVNNVNNIANDDNQDENIAIARASEILERTEDYDVEELGLEELEALALAMEDNYRDDLNKLNEGRVLVDGKEMEFEDAKSHSLVFKEIETQQEESEQREKTEKAEADISAETEVAKAISSEEGDIAVAKITSSVEDTSPKEEVAKITENEKVEAQVVHVNAIKFFEKITGEKIDVAYIAAQEREAAKEAITPKAHNVTSNIEYDTEGMVWTDGPSDTKDDRKMHAAEQEVIEPVVISCVTYDTEDMVWTDGPNHTRPRTTSDSSDKDYAARRLSATKNDSWSDLPENTSDISPPSLDDMDSEELGAMALFGAEAEFEANRIQEKAEAKVEAVLDDSSSGIKDQIPIAAAAVIVTDLGSEEGETCIDGSSAAAARQIDGEKERKYTSDGETIVSKMEYTWANVLAREDNDLPLDIEFNDDISIADSEISCWTEKRDAARKAKKEQEAKEQEGQEQNDVIQTSGDIRNLKEMMTDEVDFKRLQEMAGCEIGSESSSEDEESFESDDDFSC
mmetsp:Transcript_22684/g.33496  ORF Transcript_22684/g.33496 Transcript_22684/m.33496 type:complete len:683 (-) Transcript_22684:55-2103(-)